MNISIEPVLKQKIESWIQDLSIKIYGDFVQSVNDYNLHLDPYSLYLSWKLRGDNPNLYRKMYFDYVLGKLPDDRYKRMLTNYENEQKEYTLSALV